jgi:hypothetical protein
MATHLGLAQIEMVARELMVSVAAAVVDIQTP